MINPHANQISAPSTNRGTGALEVIALEFRSEAQGSSHSCLYDWIISLDKKKPVSPHPTVFNNIVPRAWMSSESIINHEAEGWLGYWLRGHEGKRLVKNIETKQLKLVKHDSAAIVLVFRAVAFCY